jgi:conjugative relaxase-like TrwC/TraI family protein
MLTIRAMSNGEGYAGRHLQKNDYYSEGEKITGEWKGRGAELLGLAGEVDLAAFEALREGRNPADGEQLRQRKSADRKAQDGSLQSKGRNLYDFTFSAPKSVSLMAEFGEDERLVQAHREAVAEALEELERHAATRVRREGANEDRVTGNLVLAVYHHDTSRELDPQLHTHAVAANLTFDRTEERWKALQASGVYDRRTYLTEVYRNVLARKVAEHGYTLEHRRDTRGKDLGFEIAGVSDELMQRFSQRSKQRDQAIEQFIKAKGRRPTDNEIAVLVRETRADKLLEISTAEVKAQQRARLQPGESEHFHELAEEARLRPALAPEQHSADPALRYAEDHIFERVSVARDYEILTEALRHRRGQVELADAQTRLRFQEADGEVIRSGNDVTTRDSLIRERRMVAQINRGIGRFKPLDPERQFQPDARTLRAEQQEALRFVLDSRDVAVNIRGAAGAGKTATLRELHRALQETGHQVLAAAPTRSAVDELVKVGFAEAMTLERLLQDRQVQDGLQGKVIILDEAGMVSARQMAETLQLLERHNARVVFSGDTKQIQSVEAGDALRVLEQESRLQSTSLTQIQRQSNLKYRAAIRELRRDPEAGFARLEQMGAVQEVSFEDRAQFVATLYRAEQNQLNQRGQQPQVLVVAPTHEEIGRLTDAIRRERFAAGELGDPIDWERQVSLSWTDAQKRDVRRYEPGQRLVFHSAVAGIAKYETLTVERIEKDSILARNSAGELRTVTSRESKKFDVQEARPIEIASGDRLLLTANRRSAEFRTTNGELVTVARVEEGQIHLEDGRTLPADYKQFAHGYVVTAHRSQGKTVDSNIVVGDRMARELFYVAVSRGRERVAVVTSDTELFRESLGISGARQSATELAREQRKPQAQKPESLQQASRNSDSEPALAVADAPRLSKPRSRR